LSGIAARGGIIYVFAALVLNGTQFLRAILLARILSPADFGLMGMALVVIRAGESLSQTGFSRALVHKRGKAEAYLDTVWVVSAVRGLLLFGLTWVLAPLMGAFFANEAVVPILRAVGLVFVGLGLMNPAYFLVERELAFARSVGPRLLAFIVDLVASVSLAMYLRSVWGMVWGYLLGKAVHVLGAYAVRPYLPRFRVNLDQAKEFYRYGRYVFRGAIVDYVVSQADRIVIGRLLGASSLGLYTFAWRLASLPATGFYDLVVRVAFPVFAQVQENPSRTRVGFVRALGLMSTMAAPMAAGLWVISDDLSSLVFGPRWEGMLPAFHVLCFCGASLSLYYLTRSILAAVGRPDLAANGAYTFLVTMLLPLYPAVRLAGIVGAAWCLTMASVAGFTYVLLAATRLLGCPLRRCARAMAPSALAALGMAVALGYARGWLGGSPTWGILAGEILAGVVLYSALAMALDFATGAGMLESVRTAVGSARSGKAGRS
jgi:O-antigen/teichoic acid export membrane protein